jgi:ribonucleoside-diphosphate reductase alpha chain
MTPAAIAIETTLQEDYLKSKGLTPKTASKSKLSDAEAYAACYTWYTDVMKVLVENASLAARIWVDKYALHNKEGICLEMTPPDMWRRIAHSLAMVEDPTEGEVWRKFYSEFCALQEGFAFTGQGSVLYSVGNPYINSSASNCFLTTSPEDSIEGIFGAAGRMARIFSRRGGVGICLDQLRPKNASVNNAAKTTTGAPSYMDFYSYVTGLIGQAGRRGALMITMSVSHPDIEEFIDQKSDKWLDPFFSELAEVGININSPQYFAVASRLKSTTNANVSVTVTREFLKAVEEDTDWTLQFEFKDGAYPTITRTVRAKAIWDKITYAAWKSAEPGILNMTEIRENSPADAYSDLTDINQYLPEGRKLSDADLLYSFQTNGTNPCSELPLSFGDTCTLGSFYLAAYVVAGKFDYELFAKNIKLGVRFMDNVKSWDYTNLPLAENEQPSRLGRRIGLGIHGLADCLTLMGFKYDTPEAVQAAEQILEFLKNTAYMASVELGKEKGVFPCFAWEKEKDNLFIQRLAPEVQEAIRLHGRRNISMLTIAPTGSISILSRNCSSGIEPVFKKSYLRTVKRQGSEDTDEFVVHHQALEDRPDLEHLFVEANEVDPRQRIFMQAALQRHIDHAISSTLNLKAETTQEEVGDIYLHAFRAGLKGVTVYRDGCRTGILNAIKPKEVLAPKNERPKVTDIKIHKVKYKNQNYMVLVGLVNGRPIEVFGGLEDGLALPTKYQSATLTKKSRGHYSLSVQLSDDPEDVLKVNNVGARFPAEDIMTLTRLVSLSLRNGVGVGDIVDQLQKSAGGMFDAPAIFARVLKNYMTDTDVESLTSSPCPQCGGQMEMKREGGCFVETCMDIKCGHVNSKCN